MCTKMIIILAGYIILCNAFDINYYYCNMDVDRGGIL